MKEWKYEMFAREHPGTPRLGVVKIEEPERMNFVQSFSLALRASESGESILSEIYSRLEASNSFDCGDGSAPCGQCLLRSLTHFASSAQHSVVIAFPLSSALSELDRCSIETLTCNFDYVWFPITDDLLILDAELRWAVMVYHYAVIRGIRLPGPPG